MEQWVRLCGLLIILGLLSACTQMPTIPRPIKVIHSKDWRKATKEVVAEYTPSAEARLKPYFEKAHTAYPPKQVALLGFKHERRLELWARNHDHWHYIRQYPLTAFSGFLGPKTQAHDRQIPEGIYHIQFLDPFSRWHLSMKLDYPNRYDRQHAKHDGRVHLGGDIFIHGRASSIGCVAIGDDAIEELFVLIAKAGTHAVRVILAPNDLRTSPPLAILHPHPSWTPELDKRISLALAEIH